MFQGESSLLDTRSQLTLWYLQKRMEVNCALGIKLEDCKVKLSSLVNICVPRQVNSLELKLHRRQSMIIALRYPSATRLEKRFLILKKYLYLSEWPMKWIGGANQWRLNLSLQKKLPQLKPIPNSKIVVLIFLLPCQQQLLWCHKWKTRLKVNSMSKFRVWEGPIFPCFLSKGGCRICMFSKHYLVHCLASV